MRALFFFFCLLIATNLPSTAKADLDFLRSLKTDNYGEKALSYDQKHISDQELLSFVSDHVAELFNIEGGMIEAVIKAQKPHFDDNGLKHFINFLKRENLSSLNTQYYTTISTIITEQPILLNQAPLDGSYRWLVETTIMISLHNNNTEAAKYSSAQKEKLFKDLKLNKKEYIIQMQIRRDPTATNPHQILIEDFIATLKQ